LGAVTAERLQQSIDEAVASFNLSRTPTADTLFNFAMLPEKSTRMIPN
jgi:hypothetical protein